LGVSCCVAIPVSPWRVCPTARSLLDVKHKVKLSFLFS
jgi:hypothetical protein